MNAARLGGLIIKETRELVRDPVTITLALIMPMVMLFLFGYAVNLDVKDVPLGVYDRDRTPASRALVDHFVSTPYFDLYRYLDSSHELETAMQDSGIRLAIVIPEGFNRALLRNESAPVQVIIDGTYSATASLVTAYASAIVASFPVPYREAVNVKTRIWYNPSLKSINYTVPGLFAVILMAFPPLLTALAIVREKETGTIQQIYASPVTSAEFILGKLIPYGGVAFLEILMVMLVGYLWFHVPFRGNLALLLIASLIYVLTTVGVGLLVSVITRTQLAAMLVALIVTLMPSFLFSGFLFPVFTMPVAVQLYSQLFPATHFMDVSRGIMLRAADLRTVSGNLVWLLIYTITVFAVSALLLKQKVK